MAYVIRIILVLLIVGGFVAVSCSERPEERAPGRERSDADARRRHARARRPADAGGHHDRRAGRGRAGRTGTPVHSGYAGPPIRASAGRSRRRRARRAARRGRGGRAHLVRGPAAAGAERHRCAQVEISLRRVCLAARPTGNKRRCRVIERPDALQPAGRRAHPPPHGRGALRAPRCCSGPDAAGSATGHDAASAPARPRARPAAAGADAGPEPAAARPQPAARSDRREAGRPDADRGRGLRRALGALRRAARPALAYSRARRASRSPRGELVAALGRDVRALEADRAREGRDAGCAGRSSRSAPTGKRPRGRRLRYAVGELLNCTRCMGAWSALGLVALRAALARGRAHGHHRARRLGGQRRAALRLHAAVRAPTSAAESRAAQEPEAVTGMPRRAA